MKVFRYLLLWMLTLFIMIPAVRAHVTLLKPEERASYEPGSTITIQWRRDQEHEQLDWDLLFSPDAGITWVTIAMDLPVDQFEYTWTFPDSAIERARVQIIQDNVKTDYHDTNEFAIGESYDVILGNESWVETGKNLKIFPNPVQEEFDIIYHSNVTGHLYMNLYDANGRFRGTLLDQDIAAGELRKHFAPDFYFKMKLNKGLYYLQVVDREEKNLYRLIIN